jgi:(2S)-methylsuccinyl-CoA dehydrogenase
LQPPERQSIVQRNRAGHGELAVTLDDLARQAQLAAEGLLDCAISAVRERVSAGGRLDAAKIEAEQHAVHGLAWLATYVEAIKEMAAYARRMHEESCSRGSGLANISPRYSAAFP